MSTLRERREGCWDAGRESAREAYEWIVEDATPSTIPTTTPEIQKLCEDLEPRAKELHNSRLTELWKGQTIAVPKDMWELWSAAFQMELYQLLIRRAILENEPL